MSRASFLFRSCFITPKSHGLQAVRCRETEIVKELLRWMTPICVVVALAAPASGQIDHRVNRDNAGMSGRALDHNPGLYSGGINQPVPGFDGGIGANALITGNLTGLGRFHADTPVASSNAFRISLPSAGLSRFERLSVGATELRPRQVQTPTLYFGIQETIPDLGFVRRGLNAPGSSKLATPYIVPPAASTPPMLLDADRSDEREPGDARVDQQGDTRLLGVLRHERLGTGPRTRDLLEGVGPRFNAAAESSIFGTPPPSTFAAGDLDSWWASRLLQEDAIQQDREQTRASGAIEGLLGSNQEPVGAFMATGVQEPAAQKPASRGLATPETGFKTQPVQAKPEPAPRMPGAWTPDSLGSDRFADLYSAVRTAEQAGVTRLGFEVSASPGEQGPVGTGASAVAPSSVELPTEPQPERLRRAHGQSLSDLASAAKWATDLLEDPLTTFAGRNEDALNKYIASGEKALREGEYYRAARLFEMAKTVDPRNPLPWLQRGHALVAAGDYGSAVWSLQQGIKRFPQIAAFRIDLPGIAGQTAVFDVRRADLETKLAVEDNYELRFLLGYLELYSGLPESGIRNLQQAAASAPEGSAINMFADLILGRRELPSLRTD